VHELPNIAIVLKEEIARLARKELRGGTQRLKKVSTQYRSDIAALKRRVATLEKQLVRAQKGGPRAAKEPAAEEATTRLRFSAAGLAKLRKRLDLSAADFAKLVGVSGQSIYKWEAQKAHPRAAQVAAIAALRGLSRKEAATRLAELA
jgi:DNA-binding transcriptional regulator YiaG